MPNTYPYSSGISHERRRNRGWKQRRGRGGKRRACNTDVQNLLDDVLYRYGAVIVKQPKRNKYDFIPRVYTRGIYKRPIYGWSGFPSEENSKKMNSIISIIIKSIKWKIYFRSVFPWERINIRLDDQYNWRKCSWICKNKRKLRNWETVNIFKEGSLMIDIEKQF